MPSRFVSKLMNGKIKVNTNEASEKSIFLCLSENRNVKIKEYHLWTLPFSQNFFHEIVNSISFILRRWTSSSSLEFFSKFNILIFSRISSEISRIQILCNPRFDDFFPDLTCWFKILARSSVASKITRQMTTLRSD